MTIASLALLGMAGIAQIDAVPPTVSHPEIPCWAGERSWTPAGEAPSDFISYDTRNDLQPYLITHNRDQFRRDGEVREDYNFIDYWFGDPAHPIHARHYLRSDEVSVNLPGDAGERFSLEEIRSRFPPDILCYLQRRFDRITVLVADGYQELWSRSQ